MNMKSRHQLTLHQQATYHITVPGVLDEGWTEWDGKIAVAVGRDAAGLPVTTLTGAFDQAALHGLLRQLYSLGLPLISVIWVDCTEQG